MKSNENSLNEMAVNQVKVSIIVPVYNVEGYLGKCLDSLIDQTLKEIEIVCINDGSVDGSAEILREYSENDSRIKVINQENQGVSRARNNALKEAVGKYILYVDSDDFIELNTCEELYNLCEKNRAEIAVFGGYVFTEDDTDDDYLNGAKAYFENILTTRSVLYANNSMDALLKENGSWPLLCNKFYTRELVLESGEFSSELALGEDEAFLFSIFPLAKRVVFTSEKYYHYLRNRPQSATDRIVMDFEKRAKSNLKMAEIVYDDWSKKGLMKKYEDEYLNRYVDLLFESVNSVSFNPSFQIEYAKDVLDFFNLRFEGFPLKLVKVFYSDISNRNAVNDLNGRLNSMQSEIRTLQNQLAVSNAKIQAYSESNSAICAMTDMMSRKRRKAGHGKAHNRRKAYGFESAILNAFLGKKAGYQKMKNVMYELYHSGYLTYRDLKKRFGSGCAFFACAAGGIGDAYLTACFAQQIASAKGISDFVILLCGRAEKAMLEALFPQLRGKCVIITVMEHEWLRNFDRMCNGKSDFYFFHHYDYMQPHLQISEKLQGYKNINMKEMYLWRMGLPLNSTLVPPKNPMAENSADIEKMFSENDLKKGKTVVIAPYSTCLGKLSDDFWEDIVAFLKSKQYTVCTNCAPGQEPLRGTKAISPEFGELLSFLNVARGGFIGYRSGLCDVVSSSACKQIILHPYRSAQWGEGTSLKYVGIANMGLNDNVIEIELPDNPKKVQSVKRKIMECFK